jgi:arylsulfatase A-like enzyme
VDGLTPGYRGRFANGFEPALQMFAINSGQSQISESDTARLRALYAGEINYLDRAFQAFLDQLRNLRPLRDTIVVVLSDHGEEFMEHGKLGHGETVYAPALHVPLAISWPGHVSAGTSDTPVGLVDVLPTILDLLGDRPRAEVDGRSLVELMRGDPRRASPAQFAELATGFGDCLQNDLPASCRVNALAVRTARFTFISSDIPKREALYDAINDPTETVDVGAQFASELEIHRELARDYAGSAAPSPEASNAIDDETRARLRALGYLR